MKSEDLKIGAYYKIQINYHSCVVCLNSIETRETKKHGGYKLDGTPKPYKTVKRTIYLCTNMENNRTTQIKSASKFQSEICRYPLTPN